MWLAQKELSFRFILLLTVRGRWKASLLMR